MESALQLRTHILAISDNVKTSMRALDGLVQSRNLPALGGLGRPWDRAMCTITTVTSYAPAGARPAGRAAASSIRRDEGNVVRDQCLGIPCERG